MLRPAVTLSAGAITKSIGRSYAFAWENSNKFHVGAPSPATSYIAYAAQQGAVKCVQAGTVATTSGSAVVTGTGTAFTSAWIGRRIWIDTLGGAVAQTNHQRGGGHLVNLRWQFWFYCVSQELRNL
jgi:hypothetical protein